MSSSKGESFAKAVGCEKCNGSGYSGREGVFEIMPVSESIQQMIQERPNLNQIKAELVKLGVPSLAHAGIQKVRKRKTTLEELLRVITITKQSQEKE